MTDKAIQKKFQKTTTTVEIERYRIQDRTIRYISVGDISLPLVIFFHGAPGSSQDFYSYLQDSTLLRRCHMIAVDRPGYGGSDYGRPENSILKQAELLEPLLEKYAHKKATLVGHSYGGPVAAALAMNSPDKIHALILAASALAPEHEKQFWFNSWVSKLGMYSRLPKPLQVAYNEKMSHVEALKELTPKLWEKITIPVTLIHGKNDMIVPYANAEFGMNMLKNTEVKFISKQNLPHTFIFYKKDVLREAILAAL